MRSILFGLILLTPMAMAAPDWSFVKEKQGIKVWEKAVPGTSILAFRGEGDVDAPIERVATVIFDTKRAPEWVVDLKESKLVRWISENEFLEYDHIGTPPIIMKDRDFVSKVTIAIDRVNKGMRFDYKSITDPALPETKYIRGDLMGSTFILTSIDGGKRTHIVGEITCDPKGSVAKWIVNFFQKQWPVDTLSNLREQVAKKDIVVEEKFKTMFTQPATPAIPAMATQTPASLTKAKQSL